MSQFALQTKWLNNVDNSEAGDELDATFASLEIRVAGKNVSEFAVDRGSIHKRLHIPIYYIAEWIAENWWQILYEPRKTEDDSRPEFLARHSLIAAQHGFPLPAVHFIPTGRGISVFSSPRRVSLAGARFRSGASTNLLPAELSDAFRSFVSDCVDRLNEASVIDTPLVEAWNKIRNTSPEEEVFCQLIGSLGLDPYDVDPHIAGQVDWLYDNVGVRATRDFCLAASEEDFYEHFGVAKQLNESLPLTQTSQLGFLSNVPLPKDVAGSPSWRRGVQAAKLVRERLSFRVSDETVPDKFFEHLGFSTRQNFSSSLVERGINRSFVGASLSGFLERREGEFRLALSPTHQDQRRFAATRGIYLAWASETESRRFVTGAVTRDQQASRAFAAELLVPADYIKAQAQDGRLELGAIEEIARSRRASQEIVRLQAFNNDVRVNDERPPTH